MNVFLVLLMGINIWVFLMMAVDKGRSKKGKWRIPETHLFMLALLGGATGIILGMHCFRHKTKHKSFVYGMPMILILNIVVVVRVLLYLK